MDELSLLGQGRIGLVGRVLESSNATFVVDVASGEDYAWAVYKPVAGERPLWDFEPGLHRRERAAYVLSEFLGWGIVPPTVLREDGPLGAGSLQWFVEADAHLHYFSLYQDRPETHDALRRLAVFDVVTNNTDRKGGHVLLDAAGRVWGIDHGLCFAAEPKLRTVIWDFAGEPVPGPLLADLEVLADDAPAELDELLSRAEVLALLARVQLLLQRGVLPFDGAGRRYPWPLV